MLCGIEDYGGAALLAQLGEIEANVSDEAGALVRDGDAFDRSLDFAKLCAGAGAGIESRFAQVHLGFLAVDDGGEFFGEHAGLLGGKGNVHGVEGD
jgi:hypothetical protein